MLILVFSVKSPSQNDVFEVTDHKYHLCNLRTWFSYVPNHTTNKKHITINETILRETWCLWGIIWLQRTILQSISYSIMTNHNSYLIGHISLLKLLDSFKSQNWPLQQLFKLITKSTLCQLHWLNQKSLDTTVTWHKQNMTNDTVHNHALFPWCQLAISRKLLS